ncbi:MAG: JAB domain-containing protein, partial [Candidatus Limnocylindrales bacterium]
MAGDTNGPAVAEIDVLAARKPTSPPRLVRETPEPMAQCPSCGARLALGAEGARWTVHSPRDVSDRLILQLAGLEREELHVLVLDMKHHVKRDVTVYVGNVSAALVRIGELFRDAVHDNAAAILCVHNHPSGDPTPSPDDLRLTVEMVAAGRLLDVPVLDHIIVAGTAFVSLRDQGVVFGNPGERR